MSKDDMLSFMIFGIPCIILKEKEKCVKKLCNPYISATVCRRPLIFQTMNYILDQIVQV